MIICGCTELQGYGFYFLWKRKTVFLCFDSICACVLESGQHILRGHRKQYSIQPWWQNIENRLYEIISNSQFYTHVFFIFTFCPISRPSLSSHTFFLHSWSHCSLTGKAGSDKIMREESMEWGERGVRAKEEREQKKNWGISDAEREEEGERDGSPCHSGFMLAAQFDEGKRGKRAKASEANNTSVQRWGDEGPSCLQTGSTVPFKREPCLETTAIEYWGGARKERKGWVWRWILIGQVYRWRWNMKYYASEGNMQSANASILIRPSGRCCFHNSWSVNNQISI